MLLLFLGGNESIRRNSYEKHLACLLSINSLGEAKEQRINRSRTWAFTSQFFAKSHFSQNATALSTQFLAGIFAARIVIN